MTVATVPAAPAKQDLYSDDEVHVELFKNGTPTNTLVITFDPILYGWEKPPFGLQFLRKQAVDVLAVRKKRENFYQPLSRELFLAIVGPVLGGYARVVGYGSSLGAYCALYFCSQLDCDVVATSPRVSAHPRYGVYHWQAKVTFEHRTFDDLPAPRCRATIIFDPMDAQDGPYMQGEVLPYFRDARQLRAPYSGHPSGYFLNEIGYVGDMMRAVIAGQPLPPFDRKKKAASWTYLQVLAAACGEHGKSRWARALVDRSLALNPRNPIAHRTKAKILLAARQLEQAKESIDRAYELNANDDVIKRLMVEIYLALGLGPALEEKLPGYPLDLPQPASVTRSEPPAGLLVQRLVMLRESAGGLGKAAALKARRLLDLAKRK